MPPNTRQHRKYETEREDQQTLRFKNRQSEALLQSYGSAINPNGSSSIRPEKASQAEAGTKLGTKWRRPATWLCRLRVSADRSQTSHKLSQATAHGLQMLSSCSKLAKLKAMIRMKIAAVVSALVYNDGLRYDCSSREGASALCISLWSNRRTSLLLSNLA